MPTRGRKTTSPNDGAGTSETEPQVQDVTEAPSEPLQENPPTVALTELVAAPESATPENWETPTKGSHTQGTEPVVPPEDQLDKELQAAGK